ncbi:sideroflexin-1-like [Hydractinia symbiolongicarpus]|uniref:sideroflexin-1-like n=1 Tax=Hydractinia symbiolongicarpus TaxID=13093 RepID=UPI00254DA266|nr:sideroflexin-1-like [Hydractinia symbiolongicarpus]
MTEAPKDSNGRLVIDSPRWLQDTFTGRAKHFFNVTDPRNLFANDATLEAAKTLVEKYRLGVEPAGTSDEEVWNAKKIYSSAFHPDTGEKQLLIGRMSAQVPMNMTITGAMMTFYKTTPAVIFWQWVNQSFNAVVNYTNRSGDQPISTKMLSQAYVSATGAALIVALGLNSMVKSLPPLVGRYVPFAAVAAANCVNIPLMRQRELLHGIPVFDDNGNRLGESKVAARHAVVMTVFSRIVMASPGMAIPPIIMNNLEKKSFMKRMPWLAGPLQIGMVGFILVFATPLCCAIFPQISSIATSKLEPELQDAVRKKRDDLHSVYFNKGL